MMVVSGGIIPTGDQKFLLEIGENNSKKKIRCCDTKFGLRTFITDNDV